ncbi:MAG: hypothetical protein ACI8TQ_000026 [Planctomycetota bacterium]|jgi:hypothetical protein
MSTLKCLATTVAAALLVFPLPLSARASSNAQPVKSADTTVDLVVNGEVISAEAVRRELVYRLGAREIEARKLELFLRTEIEQRGLKIEDLIQASDVDTVIKDNRAKMKEEYGGELTEEEILANSNIDLEGWRNNTRLMLLFNKLFIPENPDEWPEVTRMALEESIPEGQREMFMQKMREGFAARQAAGDSKAADDPQRMMFNMMLRGPIQASLEEAANIKTAQDGIPAEIAMIVHGVEIRTDEIFNSLPTAVSETEWQRTRMWLAKTVAVRQALEKQGAFMNDKAFDEVWTELESKYAESFIPLEQLVISFKHFPSMSAYRTFYRGAESYRNLIKDEINDENLTKHLERANRLMGLEQVDADVILLSAYDFRLARWKDNGWEEAKQRAIDVSSKLANGGDWSELLVANSDYWDTPTPASQRGQAQQGSRNNHGQFGLKNRNSLLPMVHENDYQIFLAGTSVGDTIFFDTEIGSMGGPYKGTYGYYIVRVNNRVPANKSYSLADANHRESIVHDYLQVRFTQFAAKAIAEADVQGL